MTPSMSFSRNEVVLLPIPFTDLTSRKVRPAVVIATAATSATYSLFPSLRSCTALIWFSNSGRPQG
jgi:hypothetical protein